jgi:hypothetical protein
MPLAIAMSAYYVGGILIFGNTPGVCLFGALGTDDGPAGEHHETHATAGARRAM